MNASDFIAELADATKAQIAAVVTPLLERIAVLESQVAVPLDLDLVASKAMRLVPPAPAGKDAPLPDLDVIAIKAAALVPAGRDGKDADATIIASLQSEVLSLKSALNARPAIDVEASVRAAVDLAVKAMPAMPAPKDGKDGRDADPVDVEAIAVKAAALIERPKDGRDAAPVDLDALALKAAALIEKPKDGRDGKDVDMPALLKSIADAVAAQPKPRDGRDVHPDHVASLVAGAVDRVLATWERPADGKSVTVDDVAPLVKSVVAEAVSEAMADVRSGVDGVGIAGGVIDQDGNLRLTKSDGTAMLCGRVVGAPGRDADMALLQKQISDEIAQIPKPKDGIDGKDGAPGVDGLGFDDMDGILDDEKGFIFRWARGERVREKAVPLVLDRGVYKPGVLYRKGAAVTAQGSLWIAQADTRERPGDGSTSWRLAVKKGRDGRDLTDRRPE